MVEAKETNDKEIISNITKTKAKKLLFVSFDKENKTVLKEIKKDFSNVILTKIPSKEEEKVKYQLEFSNPKIAKTAKNELIKKFDSKLVKVESALLQKKKENVKIQKEKLNEQKKSGAVFEVKIPKIIIRNLSFKFNDELLKKEMEKYGKVKLINLPKKEDGKLFGYGFVVFETMKDAKKAIEELNSRTEKLLGTKVAADWCLPKNIFIRNSNKSTNEENDEEKDDSENEAESDRNEDADEEDESGSDEDEDENEEKENKKPIGKNKKNEKFERKAKDGTLDVQEKRTIFIRNLSYECTEETLKETFSKFGPIKYAKLCWDKELERPKGTGFIQFENSQSALDACAESDILEMDFRTLQIDMAISRSQVNDIVEEKKTSDNLPKDNRNLALAKEGIIYPNSYEAAGLTKTDLQKRQKLEAINAEKLKLLHFFVSPTRLSVHNIPTKFSDEELRNIFMKAIGEDPDFRKGKNRRSGIVECRIMRDLTRVNSTGVCKSKGFGFVEFTSFELAKKALHATNNNPSLFKNGTRLIVQFSIENSKVIKKKKERVEKSKLKNTKTKVYAKNKEINNTHEDEFENLKKIKEKNLIKVHMVEKKILKRKADEEKKAIKKQRSVPKNKRSNKNK